MKANFEEIKKEIEAKKLEEEKILVQQAAKQISMVEEEERKPVSEEKQNWPTSTTGPKMNVQSDVTPAKFAFNIDAL